jgi:hypothetical protein
VTKKCHAMLETERRSEFDQGMQTRSYDLNTCTYSNDCSLQ